MFSLELGEEVSNITCNCCGAGFKSVCGFIKKDDDAFGVYFATLHTGHTDITESLTISIGKWWDDTALDERHWVELTVKPSGTNFNMRLEEPNCSRHKNFKPLGIASVGARLYRVTSKRISLPLPTTSSLKIQQ